MSKPITDYDSDWSPAFRAFDSEEFLDSNAKQSAAHSFAFVLFHLKQLLQKKDIESALNSLEEALDEVFLHTDIFHLNKKLFLQYLEGSLRVEDEPLHFFKRALRHGKNG
jgi:hypothetical protein